MVEEQRHHSDAICPYCKYTYGDMWEAKCESDDIKCAGCGKKFHWYREVDVEYVTSCNCKDNNEEHDFEMVEEWLSREKDGRKFKVRDCKKCSQYLVEYKDNNDSSLPPTPKGSGYP